MALFELCPRTFLTVSYGIVSFAMELARDALGTWGSRLRRPESTPEADIYFLSALRSVPVATAWYGAHIFKNISPMSVSGRTVR